MDHFVDALTQPMGTYHETGSGGVLQNPLGGVVARTIPTGTGGHIMTDSLGQVLERVEPIAGGFQHFNNMGQVTFTQKFDGHQNTLTNSMGQVLMQHDPCTGSITNAIGTLVGRHFKI